MTLNPRAPSPRLLLFILCLEAVAITLNVAAISPLVPGIAQGLNTSNYWAGRVIVAYLIPYGAMALVWGPLASRWSQRKLKIGALFCFCLFNLLCAFSFHIGFLLGARFLVGFFASAAIPLSLTFIGELFPLERRGQGVGTLLSFTYSATLAGIFLSGILPWRALFFLPVLIGGIAWILIYKYLPAEKALTAAEIENQASYWRVISSPWGWRIYSYLFMVSFFLTGLYSWMGVYMAQELGFSQRSASWLMSSLGLGSILGGFSGGRISDSIGRGRAIPWGLILVAVSIIFFAYSKNPWWIASSLLGYGIGRSLNHSSLVTMLTDFPSDMRMKAASLNSAIIFAGGGLGAAMTEIFIRQSFFVTFVIYGLFIFLLGVISTPYFRLQENKS